MEREKLLQLTGVLLADGAKLLKTAEFWSEHGQAHYVKTAELEAAYVQEARDLAAHIWEAVGGGDQGE